MDEISIFLKNVWAFFFAAIRRWDKEKAHNDFLDFLDDRKYGKGNN